MCKSTKIKCPRCGGTGKVEHTHVVEGICFMCAGFGEVFPKRVGELTEKAKIRKSNKEANYQKELKESKEKNDNYWDEVYTEITKRNKKYFENYKVATHEGAMEFYKKVKGMSAVLGFNESTSEEEVRGMFKDYFKSSLLYYKLEISKYTLKYYSFCFIDLDGRKTDLTDSINDIQNLIKYNN